MILIYCDHSRERLNNLDIVRYLFGELAFLSQKRAEKEYLDHFGFPLHH